MFRLIEQSMGFCVVELEALQTLAKGLLSGTCLKALNNGVVEGPLIDLANLFEE